MEQSEKIIKLAIDSAKLALLEFDRKLTEEFSPKLDYVSITIHPDEYKKIKSSLSKVSELIHETKDAPVLMVHSLYPFLEVTEDQELYKIVFQLKVTKETKVNYINFIVPNLATLHNFFSKQSIMPSNLTSYEDGNKQFFVESTSVKIGFSKKGFPETQEINFVKNKLKKEIQSKLLVMADYQNYRKRMEKTLRENIDSANTSFLNHIMDVVDDCKRALQDKPNETAEMLIAKLSQLLTEQGFSEISIKPGDDFDPSIMEAITTTSSKEQKPNTVIHVDQTGYKKNKNIFRPAKVIVVK